MRNALREHRLLPPRQEPRAVGIRERLAFSLGEGAGDIGRVWVWVCVCACAFACVFVCACTRQGGTKSPANPFTGNGCHPSNPFKFDLAIDNKKGLHDRSLFSDWRRWKRRVAGKLNEAGGGIPGLTRFSDLNKSNVALFSVSLSHGQKVYGSNPAPF